MFLCVLRYLPVVFLLFFVSACVNDDPLIIDSSDDIVETQTPVRAVVPMWDFERISKLTPRSERVGQLELESIANSLLNNGISQEEFNQNIENFLLLHPEDLATCYSLYQDLQFDAFYGVESEGSRYRRSLAKLRLETRKKIMSEIIRVSKGDNG